MVARAATADHEKRRNLQTALMKEDSVLVRGKSAGWRAWVRFTHTGEAGVLWGETLAVIAASGAIALSLTGIALSLDRLRRWRT
jgi:hypothetical protein